MSDFFLFHFIRAEKVAGLYKANIASPISRLLASVTLCTVRSGILSADSFWSCQSRVIIPNN